jgi:hypothetical protein
MRITYILAAAALALGACSKPAPDDKTPAAGSPSWVTQNSIAPDWIPVAQGADGTIVSYDPRSITRDAAAGTADIWVQYKHKYGMFYHSEDDKTKRELEYYVERVLYRFRCAPGDVATVERRLMDQGDVVAETFRTPPAAESDWKPVAPNGPTAVVIGPACRST